MRPFGSRLSSHRKKVYIKAYLNHNLGDDLFIEILVNRYPETQFYLYAPPGYCRTFSHLKNLKVYETAMPWIRLFNKLFLSMGFGADFFDDFLKNRCGAVVQIGGSIFRISDRKYRENIDKMLRLTQKGKKLFIIGSNFCKGFDETFRRDHCAYFSRAEDVCFRDEYSYRLFHQLGNVRKAADVIFGLKPAETKEEENCILLSVIDFKVRSAYRSLHDCYRDKMAELMNLFAAEGFQVKLISFCQNEGDEDMAEEIAGCSVLSPDAKRQLRIVRYHHHPQEAIRAIQSAKYIVAARFHAMILGLLFGKKVFAVIQGNKFSNVIADNGWPLASCHIRKIGEIQPQQVLRYFRNSDRIDVSGCIRESEKQFAALDHYLDKTE